MRASSTNVHPANMDRMDTDVYTLHRGTVPLLVSVPHNGSMVPGRFNGGYITRHYGAPGNGIDAVQLDISQHVYMDEATFAFDGFKARQAQAGIHYLLKALELDDAGQSIRSASRAGGTAACFRYTWLA